ncbi:MAG: CGNR zinc finger domain-containing protein [Anaerolineales bacterium]
MPNFDFDGGHLALDFANTAEWHASEHPVERLENYADLLEWSRQAGILDDESAEELTARARQNPRQAQRVYQQGLALRELIYRLFSAIASGETPAASDLEQLSLALASSIEHGRLVRKEAGYGLQWPESDRLERPLWLLAHTAADLLQSDRLERVGECADENGCGYLFFDTSRNHSRRWCSMESCGNRAKARSYYQRVQQES